MIVKLYRIETQQLKTSEIYYLVKSIRVRDKVRKVRVKIGKTRPNNKEELKLTTTPNIDLETKALNKKLDMNQALNHVKYIPSEAQRRLEKAKHWKTWFHLFLTTSEAKYFESAREVEYVHGTTAIEGNTFTVQQVDMLLQNGVSPSGKSLREINEVQNYLKVREYRDSYNRKVTIPFIRRLHNLVMDNIDLQSAGRFRRIDSIGITGVDISVTPALLIEEELLKIINDYYENIKHGWHPFEEAILFHYWFELIHPFTDGNGRVGREVLNHMLTKAGYPRLIISMDKREKYITALEHGNKGQYKTMINLFIDLLEDERADLFHKIQSGEIAPPQQ